MEKLTEKQKRVLQFIIGFIRQNGASPTIREIMRSLRFASPGPVQDHLKILERKGYLTSRKRFYRGIQVSSQFLGIPLVGHVGAGKTIAEEDIEGYIDVSGVFGRSGDLFGLKVKGNSMVGAGILEDDVAIVHRQPYANPGDLVVIVKDGEGSVRWLRKDRKGLILEADNPEGKHKSERFDNQLLVGKVVFLLRNYNYHLVKDYV